MTLKQNRTMSVLAATAAALAIGASPALAGEDDDDEYDSDDVTQVAPVQSSSSGSEASSAQVGVPQGGVATGAGGMAEQGPGIALLGLASGALVLMASGGRLIAVARRSES
jgi:hypothetical protein